MHPDAYEEMAQIEDHHWWFVGRRRIIESTITSLNIRAGLDILEVGAGTGGNIEMLSKFGDVTAVEINPWAVEFMKNKYGKEPHIIQGNIQDVDFDRKRFDLICALDVVEHIENDVLALARMRDLLTNGGRIILTVPAYQWLWSSHDERLHHFRRYTRGELTQKLQNISCEVDYISYFNSLSFPVAVFVRCMSRVLNRDFDGDMGAVMNGVFRALFSAERFIVPRYHLPFGLSLLAVFRPA